MDELRPADPAAVGPFRLLCRLGQGGMGRVYLGRSAQGRTVAVKLMHATLATNQECRRRFRREVRLASRVGGNWTARVVAADTEAAVPWVATAYAPALSLKEAVQRYGHLPEESVWDLAFGLARALEALQGHDLVHRDLKPSNVLLGLDGPQVIDFGITRTVGGDDLTRPGVVLGTPGYLSPEQVEGTGVTGASDVFCLGAVLVFAATGHPPYPDAVWGTRAELLATLARPPDLDGLSSPLRTLTAACLSLEASSRPTPASIARLACSMPRDNSRPWLPPALLDHLARTTGHALGGGLATPRDEERWAPCPDRSTLTADLRTTVPALSAAPVVRSPGTADGRAPRRWSRFLRPALTAVALGLTLTLAYLLGHGYEPGGGPTTLAHRPLRPGAG